MPRLPIALAVLVMLLAAESSALPELNASTGGSIARAPHEAADPPHERQPLGAPTVFNDMWALDLQSTIDQQRRAYRAAR